MPNTHLFLPPPALALVLTSVLSACGHASAVQPESASPKGPKPSVARAEKPVAGKQSLLEAPAPPDNASIADVMGDHFMITTWARDAVIAGSLDALREPLTALADYRYDDVPPGGWVTWIAQLQQAARLTSTAESLDVAAMGVATMGRTCGECHRESGGGPAIPPATDPLERFESDRLDERMGRHMWASELLWEGLTGPSDAVWTAGAKTLVDAPDELDEALPEHFDEQLRAVKELGVAAGGSSNLADRANVYGLLISTCAQCHSRWLEHERYGSGSDD